MQYFDDLEELLLIDYLNEDNDLNPFPRHSCFCGCPVDIYDFLSKEEVAEWNRLAASGWPDRKR